MSPIVDDLRIEAEIPPRSVRPGASVVVTLRFLNLGDRLRTLYVICQETYRFGQSTFHLQVGSDPPLVQPPRRAGYVPTAADFHQLAPRGKLELTQTLRLPRSIPPGKYSVQWVYENKVDHWPFPPNTKDAGQPIPGIWEGHIVDPFSVEVARPVVTPRTGR
jgi:hypothetical protein